jgi:hypothetical protein
MKFHKILAGRKRRRSLFLEKEGLAPVPLRNHHSTGFTVLREHAKVQPQTQVHAPLIFTNRNQMKRLPDTAYKLPNPKHEPIRRNSIRT